MGVKLGVMGGRGRKLNEVRTRIRGWASNLGGGGGGRGVGLDDLKGSLHPFAINNPFLPSPNSFFYSVSPPPQHQHLWLERPQLPGLGKELGGSRAPGWGPNRDPPSVYNERGGGYLGDSLSFWPEPADLNFKSALISWKNFFMAASRPRPPKPTRNKRKGPRNGKTSVLGV